MMRVLYLAWCYVRYYRIKSAILITGLTLTVVLPLSTDLVIEYYDQMLRARAATTPLIIGAKGNRFDLALKALYFSSAHLEPVYTGEVDELWDSGLAEPIPLHLEYTARGLPIVGTSLEYFDFRGLRPAQGTLPLVLGQCVLGAHAATELGLGVGDSVFSEQKSLYDIARTYPLKMHIVGVLAHTGTPDDNAVFVDVQTAWIIEGIAHGHQDAQKASDNVVLQRTPTEVVTNAAIVEYNEVTPENLSSFHTHGDPDKLPLSAIIVLPKDAKSATILKARYATPGRLSQMLAPAEVIDELMRRVFEVQRLFNAAFALVAVATGLFLLLIILLSQRLRQREMETMIKIGCSRGTTVWLQAAELLLVVAVSAVLTIVLAFAIRAYAPQLLRYFTDR